MSWTNPTCNYQEYPQLQGREESGPQGQGQHNIGTGGHNVMLDQCK